LGYLGDVQDNLARMRRARICHHLALTSVVATLVIHVLEIPLGLPRLQVWGIGLGLAAFFTLAFIASAPVSTESKIKFWTVFARTHVADFIEMGLDAYNPLEAKAGMDCVELRRQYGQRFGVCGNSNIQVWESGDRELIRAEVLRKLNAAKGGGMIFQSDHSVSSSVSGQTYDYIVNLVREYGAYPLNLGEYDIDMAPPKGAA